MTREEEAARLVEIEASRGSSENIKKVMREYFERKWWLEDHGITDMHQWKVNRMVAQVEKEVGE